MFSIIDVHDYDHSIEVVKYPYLSSDYISYKLSNQPYILKNDSIIYTKLFSNILYLDRNEQTESYFIIENKKEINKRLLEQRLQVAKGNYRKVRKELIEEDIYNIGFLNLFDNERFLLADFITDKSIVKALLWDKKLKKGLYINKYATYKPDLQMIKSVEGNTVISIWDRSAILTFREKLTDGSISGYPVNVVEAVNNFNEEEDNPILIVFTFKENV